MTTLPRFPVWEPGEADLLWDTLPEPSSTYKPLAYEPYPRFPSEAPMERGAHLQSLLACLQLPLTELP